uniref:TM1266 family iron-only hydrogenase system putative regulator n=1 Tax=Eubacterium sp. TaxID=142586 RepID=UPI0040293535
MLITALILRGFFFLGGIFTETRVAVIGIIVENRDSAAELNAVLSEYGDYIIGRMGVPYHKKNINIISVAVDAPQDVINTLGGKIGRLSGVSAKTAYANV